MMVSVERTGHWITNALPGDFTIRAGAFVGPPRVMTEIPDHYPLEALLRSGLVGVYSTVPDPDIEWREILPLELPRLQGIRQ